MSGILQGLIGSLKSAASSAADAYFNLTTLLLNTSSTNGAQNNTFLDSSTNNFTITRNGNTTQGTFTPFSQTGWSNYQSAVDTTYTSFTTSPSTLFQFAGDFTIESWVYPTVLGSDTSLWVCNDGGANYFAWNIDTTNYNVYLNSSGATSSFAHGLTANQWNHTAMVRSGSTITVYTNGVSKGTLTSSATLGYSSPSIARNGGGAAGSARYMSNLRIVKSAVYTSAFTPPTTSLTNIANTSLLTCQSNRFVDNSSNALVATITGAPSVQAFSPFAPTTGYDPAVVGGSGYFDGSGDYLSVGSGTDFDLGTSDFSIEMWYWIPSIGGTSTGLICKRQGGVATGWGMSTGGFMCLVGSSWYDSYATPYWVGSSSSTGFNQSSSTTKVGQWTHVMVTRQGTDARWFVNGQLIGYQSRSGAIDQLTGSALSLGLNGINYEQPFTGYISNARVCIGSVPTAYQTSSTTLNTQIFTPPTAPVTTTSQGANSSHVKYIGNFTNSGIYDSTAKNVLETVGNAQVSTTQAKWGTTSMYFDGTGDSLKGKLNNAIGGGDYTIEGWLYTGASGARYIFDMRETSQYLGAFTVGTTLYVNIGTTLDISATTSYPQNTWVHFAMVRSGSATNNTSIFLGGSRITQVTDTTNYSIVPTLYIGNDNTSSYSWDGYIDDFRITKGYARYSGSTYTPPAAAFPLL